jgi:hypothetical protein
MLGCTVAILGCVVALPLLQIHADQKTMVFARGAGVGEQYNATAGAANRSALLQTVWAFVNNDAHAPDRTLAGTPRLYCTLKRAPPLAPAGHEWFDAITRARAEFDVRTGCYAAPDADPKVLVLRAIASGSSKRHM